MIPKIIHYVWLGEKEMPEEHKNYVEGWKKLMPDYKFMEWNESNFDFSKSIYATQSYQNKKYGFTPDYIRAVVLEKYGGIYLDTDVEVLKPFDDILKDDFFTCFENDAYIETAILGSIPHHPYLKTIIDFYEHYSFLNDKSGKMDLTPSPIFWTYFLYRDYQMKLKSERQILKCDNGKTINLYENEYFAPINFTTRILKVTENTYAIHHFANSWSDKKQKRLLTFIAGLYKFFGRKIFAFGTKIYLKNFYRKFRKKCKKLELSKIDCH